MEAGQPSRTAFAAASYRAEHQVVDGGRLFTDPLAVPILGATAQELAERWAAGDRARRLMGLFIAVRSRFAEDSLAAAVATGTRQLVVLGAGLDTFAYRNPHAAAGLRVFEVDHPATQAWKRDRLAEAGIAVPPSLTYVPVDFERDALADRLTAAGFVPDRPAFFTWLGVVPYLTREAVLATLGYVGSLPGGATVVFDYSYPASSLSPEARRRREERSRRVAAIGEPWLCHFTAPEIAAELDRLGFTEVEDLAPVDIAARYAGRRPDPAAGPSQPAEPSQPAGPGRSGDPGRGSGHLLRATAPGRR